MKKSDLGDRLRAEVSAASDMEAKIAALVEAVCELDQNFEARAMAQLDDSAAKSTLESRMKTASL